MDDPALQRLNVPVALCLGGVDPDGCRYRTYAISPFVAYKLPGKDAGFNLQFTRNFEGRNAIQANALQLRFVKFQMLIINKPLSHFCGRIPSDELALGLKMFGIISDCDELHSILVGVPFLQI